MHKLTLRPATDDDCLHLGLTMRQQDRDEVMTASGRTPVEALRYSLKYSTHAVTAADETGRIICMFGVGPLGFMSDVGSAWLLGSDLIVTHARLFARLSRKYLSSILDLYPSLENAVDARYTTAIRWLEWLGFTVEKAEPIGIDGGMMRRFYFRRGLHVEPSSVAEIEAAPTFKALLDEYAAEAAIVGMPPPAAKMETYRQLESGGLLHAFRAVNDNELIGFITIIVPVLPHYGVGVAVTESFFVAKAHRSTLAGLKLLAKAEGCARKMGSPGLLVSAPSEGALCKVLPRAGYRESNRVFFKAVANA